MNYVKVNRNELLDVVRKNREQHRKIFEEAIEGYRSAAIKELDAMLNEAKAGKRIRRTVSLVEPVDQTREYNKVIRMLEMSTEDVIELQEHEFSQYVLDDWGWKGQFLASNSAYSSTAMGLFAAEQ
jgi:hypothetical protein